MQLLCAPAFTFEYTRGEFGGELVNTCWEGGRVTNVEDKNSLDMLLLYFELEESFCN